MAIPAPDKPESSRLTALEDEADQLLQEITHERQALVDRAPSDAEETPEAPWTKRTRHSIAWQRGWKYVAGGAISLVMAVNAWMLFHTPRAKGPYQDVDGVVESAGAAFRVNGGYVTLVLVRMPDQRLIQVRTHSSAIRLPGAVIHLHAYASGAYQIIGAP